VARGRGRTRIHARDCATGPVNRSARPVPNVLHAACRPACDRREPAGGRRSGPGQGLAGGSLTAKAGLRAAPGLFCYRLDLPTGEVNQ
jgi:hypothetical protein